ncbi:MAG: TonB-dependent receptor [Bacteroides sp.]
MKRILLLAMVCLSTCYSLLAQTLQLKGRVVCGKNAVEYANVVLQTADSAFVSGGVTDQKGRFTMNNLRSGSYRMQVSGIGYETRWMDLPDFAVTRDMGNVSVDSATIVLDEVIITAASVINAIDKKIILPTAIQLKASTNGLSLLQQMKLSRLQIDPVNRNITSSNQGDVQLRINGVQVEMQEVLSLLPQDVIRIEYYDDPGMRYGSNTAAVIDYIVRRRDAGGYVAFDTQNSPHVVFGNNNVMAKFNYKQSEFSVNYYNYYRRLDHYWRENEEAFRFSDGTSFSRMEEGIPKTMKEQSHGITLGYSYQQPDKWLFNATLRGNFYGHSLHTHSNLFPVGKPEQTVVMNDYISEHTNRPSVDLYFQRTLNNRQALIFNVVGTYIDSKEDRSYQEKKQDALLTDIYSLTYGDKYSIIGEGIYEKGVGKGKLSFGLKHQQSVTDNDYSGTTNAQIRMKEAYTTLYAEYTGKVNRFNYSAGVLGSRSWFNQSGEGYQQYSFLPRLRMTYNFSDQAFIRYRGDISRRTPNLSDMNNVTQLIDSLQLRRGNPDLKVATTYRNTLYFDYHNGLFSGNLNLFYMYQHRPVMEETLREGNHFIRTVNNQLSWQKLNPEMELKLGPFNDILTLSFTTGLNYFDSKGRNYHHTYSNWYYRAEAMANYKNWSGFFQIQNHQNDFYGETLSYGENYHVIGVDYRYKQFNLGLMTFNLFSNNYKRGSENFSALAPSKNWLYIKESARIFLLRASWNFSFGRKYKTAEQRLNNEDSNAGTLKSGK